MSMLSASCEWLAKLAQQPAYDIDTFEAGRRAYEAGETENPHRRGTIYYRSWRAGYLQEQQFDLMW
jgi:hypothetical protein